MDAHATPRSHRAVPVEYVSRPGLGSIAIVNFLLIVVTLGIYSFWGKTVVRRHIWSCVRVMDEPLEYTGTGLELFLGMLVVTGFVIVPLVLVQTLVPIILSDAVAVQVAVQVLVIGTILYLIGVGVYRARRYRLNRTVWRGIRGTLTGSPWRYAWQNFWMTLILPVSLAWSYPWMRMHLTSRMTNEMVFGSEPFRFAGPLGPLYKRFAILWFFGMAVVLILPVLFWSAGLEEAFRELSSDGTDPTTVGPRELIAIFIAATFVLLPVFVFLFAVFRAIYVAGELNHFARCTGFKTVKFEMNATTLSLIGLALGNVLILVFTLGIGAPFVQQRLMRYFCTRMTVVGTLDVAAIQQATAGVDKRGEGLAEVFDIDAF